MSIARTLLIAALLSLAHDVSDGGLGVALEEAARWSGVAARIDLGTAPTAWSAVVACPPERVGELAADGVVLTELGSVD